MDSTLFLVAEPLAQAALLSSLQQACGSLEGISVVSGSGALLDASGKGLLEGLGCSPFGRVWSVSSSPGFHTPARVARLATAAASRGVVVIQEPAQAAEGLRKAIMFSGLQGCEAAGALAQGAVALSAKKPNWESGAKQALRKKPPAKENKAKVWTLAADDDEDEDLIDDAGLLTEEDMKKPALPANDDCEIGKGGKKACKNCTCGRAEGAMPADTSTVESSCGSCYLGDAFRCSTCPYRGMPAFKPGEKITLQTDVVDL